MHTLTSTLLQQFCEQYHQHLAALGDETSPRPSLEQIPENIQRLLIAVLGHAVAAADVHGQVGSTYSPQDAMVGGVEDDDELAGKVAHILYGQ